MIGLRHKFIENGGFMTTSQLTEQGNYYRARRAVNSGELIMAARGVFALPEYLVGNMTDIEKLIPKGIVCLYSAWFFHGLTTTVPPAICVAISQRRKVVIPNIVPIKLFYWKPEYLYIGITKAEISGFRVRVTDVERSVCDAVKYRNKIGLDVCAEIIRNYLKRTNRNLSRLTNYSRQLRVYNILSKYLELYLS